MNERCDVCGHRLGLGQRLSQLRPKPGLTYPFVRVDGTRAEMPVRWLCTDCEWRAGRYRSKGEVSESEPAPRAETSETGARPSEAAPAAARAAKTRVEAPLQERDPPEPGAGSTFRLAAGVVFGAVLALTGTWVAGKVSARIKRHPGAHHPALARRPEAPHPAPPAPPAPRAKAAPSPKGPAPAPRAKGTAPALKPAAVAVSPKRKAALQVRVSAQAVGQFEPLDIKVVDPAPSQGSSPGLLTVALTDGAGARQRVVLNPLAQEGEWGGRFTPLTTGRYGGTASVKEKDGEHTGRVPVVRVNDSPLPGPVRLDPGSKRALRYSRGDVLFPVGARLAAGALHSPVEWGPELAKLRAHGATYLEVPVEWPASGKDQGRDLIHAVDALLREAEKRGSPIIQMRLQPPADLSGNAAAAYEAQLQEWVRRWSYSPVVGVWYVEGARESLPLETRRRFVRAVRNAEAYPHLVAAPGLASAKECGADLPVTPAPPRPRNQFGLIEAAEKAGDAKPEQADWKMLVLGGVGLPLRTYTPGAPDADAFLAHLEQLAAVASDVPFHAAPLPCKGAPSSGLFCRYGPAVVGWAAPDARRSVQLPSLAPGRYRVRIWNPAADRPAGEQEVQGSEKGARLALSGDLKRVFLTIRPARSRKS